MAGRTTGRTRTRKAAPRKATKARSRARKSTSGRRTNGRANGRSRAAARNDYGFLAVLGRAISGLWMALAHTVGWVVRAVGRQAATTRELDPAHQRDGFGLLALGLAIVLAVAVWFDAGGPAGFYLAHGVRTVIGSLTAALPLLLLAGAVRLMRSEGDPAHRGRHIVGWSALLLGAVGLLHLLRDQPPTLGRQKFAGGVLGELVGGTLAMGVTQYLAIPLLILLAVFGVLVVTATPVNRVPERLGYLRDLALGRTPAAEEADAEPEEEEPAPV
ncbi:MAG: DNA translocase FtsK 4TM domain-containing protein, partial [Micromonosporaceae bacterium]